MEYSKKRRSKGPRWFFIPARVLLVTFVLTLLSFAVSLLLGIVGTVIGARIRGIKPDMSSAYRHVALPAAALAGAIVLVSSAAMEVRHYSRAKALAGIERASAQDNALSGKIMSLPRIAIPMPHSSDPEYAERALPQYEHAIQSGGGLPIRIPLDESPAEVMKLIESCDAVVLPGSKADVDPAKYGSPRNPKTEDADAKRDTVDELLLQDAYNMRKPILGICYGLQILNVYRSGTLLQHIESPVNHEAGRSVAVAHPVRIDAHSTLSRTIGTPTQVEGGVTIPVNSSHHQAAEKIGDGLRVVARCPQDGIIEALEGTTPDHFVLAVQWHPERSVDSDAASRAIFRALSDAARERNESRVNEILHVSR